MGNVELFRFRSVRGIDHQEASSNGLVITPAELGIYNKLNIPPSGIATVLKTYSWIVSFSEQLASQGDLVAIDAVIALLPADWLKQADPGNALWTQLNKDLSNYLANATAKVKSSKANAGTNLPIIPLELIEPCEKLGRLLLVQDMISTLVSDSPKPQAQRSLQTPQDIRSALNFRPVTLPGNFFNTSPAVLARQPGITDLCVVQTEWNRYIPEELANVVNVLPGETFAGIVRHMEETQTTQSTSTQQTTTQQDEHSQTSSSTLSSAAANDASTNIAVQGQVEVSGQYGPTTVKTSLGAQLQSSQSTSKSSAMTLSMETVARSVKTVTQTVTEIRSTRTTVRDSTQEKHQLQNATTQVEVGLYRWLSVVNRVQLVSYPNRFVLEFEIPEPGAWLRWAFQNLTTTPWDNPDPGPFALDPIGNPNTILTADQISPATLKSIAGRWRIQGLTPPPPTNTVIGTAYNLLPTGSGDSSPTLVDNSMTVPTGYQADSWSAGVVSVRSADVKDTHHTRVYMNVGGGNPIVADAGDPSQYTNEVLSTSVNGKVGDNNTGTIPVGMYGYYCTKINVAVNVTCTQINADNSGNGIPYLQWQDSTFDQIVDGYNNLLSAHNQERDARAQSQSGPAIIGPPELNLARSAAELKRLVIEDLQGQTFTGYDLLKLDATSGEPSMNPPDTAASSPVIQFFEQVFEWENLVYICYPYFWGGNERWIANATWSSGDPVFDQFLNAGSARVVVPARPGYENLVNYFLYTGTIWGGVNPPSPNDPGYLSIANEIQSIQKGATDGTPVDPPWEVILPTTFLWAGTDPTTLPTNPAPTIGAPPAS